MTVGYYDTHSLRDYVADRLNLFYVPDSIWNKEITRRFVQSWNQAPSDSKKKATQEELVNLVREDMKALENEGVDTSRWAKSRKRRERGGTAVEVDLSTNDPIALRAGALCLYWAKLAEAERRVRQFRNDVLGGGVVSESKARNLIRSSAATLLNNVAADLCRRYPWEPQDAAWFILTGEAPWVPPLTARIKRLHPPKNHATITITAAHWVPIANVRKFYAELKARYLDSTPTPSPRRLAVFRFVVERSQWKTWWEPLKPWGTMEERVKQVYAQGLDVPTPWSSLQAQWNEEYPPGHDWHYSDYRNLRRDFMEAFEALAGYR